VTCGAFTIDLVWEKTLARFAEKSFARAGAAKALARDLIGRDFFQPRTICQSRAK